MKYYYAFPGDSMVKNLPAKQEMQAQSLDWEDPLEKELATHSSILAWAFSPPGFCIIISSVQFSSGAQSCPTLCDSMNHSTPGLPVHHQLPEFTETHVQVGLRKHHYEQS